MFLGSQTIHGKAHGLIVNADDWGRTQRDTDQILPCLRSGVLSSTSGMVFMEDSERAARIARENNMDVGLHLNFTTPFSSPDVPSKLLEAQNRLSRFLRSSKLAQVLFHPALSGAFRYVLQEQICEFERLYGIAPKRIDGHHHMHLCANVLWGNLLPVGTIVRRSFSFSPGEKNALNRMYRRWLDRQIERHHPVTDYFFSIEPVGKAEHLSKVIDLAETSLVELETHPVNIDEFRFLTGGEFSRRLGSVRIWPYYFAVKR
jgi:predicted glycoside hydrolase/deacetylase ChbG (UPF0249 family)